MAMTVPEQPQKKDFVRQYWYVFFLIWAFILAALALVLRLLLGDPLVPVQENTWEGLTPGYSTKNQVDKKFGAPVGSSPLPSGTAYFYRAPHETKLTNTVVYDPTGKVIFVKENVNLAEKQNVAAFTSAYGQEDLIVGNPDVGENVLGYVFLKQGVVVFAHSADGSVEQKWYFTPMDVAAFNQTWQTFIMPTDLGPHE